MNTLFRGAAVAAMAIALPAPLAAQNVHTSMLYEQVLENIDIAPPGYVLDSFGIVRLTPGAASHISLNVPAGRTIEIMGDCDDDCFDLDLVVHSPDKTVLAEDIEDDYYPIVDFSAGDSGRIEMELVMQDCEANYCYAAYSVFIGPES